MAKPTIVCVDDQRDILATLKKELQFFREYIQVYYCESADEAAQIVGEIDEAGEHVAVIVCDHVMPGKSGIEFLSEINRDIRFPKTKKLLLTGLATHEDTIEAINEANIDRYIGKPWESHNLVNKIRVLLTEYILEEGLEYSEFLPILDQDTLYSRLRNTV
jgi:two-component system, chemotaxis family, chemotaxis protein CheY